MKCSKCGNEIKEGEQFCSNCGKKIKYNSNNKRKIIIIFIVCILLTIVIVVGILNYIQLKSNKQQAKIKEEEEITQIGTNGNQITELSFVNMKSDNTELNLSDAEKEVLNYFDNDYFMFGLDFEYNDLQRYPNVFKGAQLQFQGFIKKIIKSTNEEFEALVAVANVDVLEGAFGDEQDNNEYDYILLKGKQLNERPIENDHINLFGRYIDIETIEVDGKSYTLPIINSIKIQRGYTRFELDTITTVAKYIFGNDIKIRKGVYMEDYDNPNTLEYVVTLDNQSNENFKAFNFSTDYGYIHYNMDLQKISNLTTEKRLFISADFQHYIVSTFDEGTKHLYIDYFNKDYSKVWSREFDYVENAQHYTSPMDYNTSLMAFTINNDLYLIDLATGENVVEPVLVGNKERVVMLSDYILLIGDNNKDAIMLVDYNGNITKKINADTQMETISDANIQLINGKAVISLSLYSPNNDYYNQHASKFIVLDSSGTVELSTTDEVSLYTY